MVIIKKLVLLLYKKEVYMIDYNSRLKDINNHPIGHDLVSSLLFQMNLSEVIIKNPLILNLKIKTVIKLMKDKDFFDVTIFDSFIRLINQHPEVVNNQQIAIEKKWWKEAVFYQIYPRSFNDSDNDGIGDIKGIIAKLDYLKNLGVDCIWLSPIYDSPQDDNGYDIRDYYEIDKMFGNIEDFKELLKQVHNRNMKIIMDLVVNHTSDEHQWFKKALDGDKDYQDYYVFREKPNNWVSFFSGSAWTFYPELNKYALHTFSKKQMDLNHDNPKVRQEVINIIKNYLSMGVDGFRMDVINLISKDYLDGNQFLGGITGITGLENYYFGPKLHQYLKEIKLKAFKPYDGFSVGETPGVGKEMAKLLTGDYRNELDMVFSFEHLENPGKSRFDDYEYDLNYYKKHIINYLSDYSNHYQMSLFFDNHDNPRMISKISKDPRYHSQIAMALATLLMTLKGTPFIFQGQEMGLANIEFKSIDQIKDVESLNLYNKLIKTKSTEEAFKTILAGTRDHARANIDWNKTDNGVSEYYHKIIKIRKENPVLMYGDIKFVKIKRKDLFAYYREYENVKYYIEINLSNKQLKRKILKNHFLILSNYQYVIEDILMPYESNIYQII
jgi:oligo-1,6-glucosidase